MIKIVFVAFVIWMVLSAIDGLMPYDDTDAYPHRSGFSVRVDARTGCQYLITAFGGATPRMDVHGFQLGCAR